MKTPFASVLLFLAATLAAPGFAASSDEHSHDKAPPASPAYPLSTCVVSGDKLGHMGKPVEYVYKQPGKPDRVVMLCCKDCIADFEKDPAAYLKKIDDAASAKAKKPDAPAAHAHEH
jgi:hypothetical protein